ncbi:MAG: CHAT domain-containing tetratricopeptide repeat protein [Chitinophagales bacterium]
MQGVRAQNARFDSLFNRCDALVNADSATEALPYCQQAYMISRQNADLPDTSRVDAVTWYANALYVTGDPVAAIPLFQLAAGECALAYGKSYFYIWIQEQVYDIATKLNRNAVKAEALTEIISTMEQVYGPEDERLIYYYYQGGENNLIGGDYAASLKYFTKARDLTKKINPEPTPDLARILVEMSSVYLTVGKYADGVRCNTEALSIIGKDTITHVDIVSDAFQLLAWNYYKMDSLETAVQWVLRIISISNVQEGLPRANALVSASLFITNVDATYGTHYAKEAGLNNALYRSLEIYDSLQADGIYINNSWLALGTYYAGEAIYDSVLYCYQRSLEITKEVYGVNNLVYLNAIAKLARNNMAYGQTDLAEKYYDTLYTASTHFLRSNFIFLSESEKESIYTAFTTNRNYIYGFYDQAKDRMNQGAKKMYDAELFTKGLLLQNITSLRNKIFAANDSITLSTFNKWVEIKTLLSGLYLSNNPDVPYWEQQADMLERSLIADNVLPDEKELSWKDIQSALQADEAAIEFVYFNSDLSGQYYALVLRNTDTVPHAIPLYTADQMDSLFATKKGETTEQYINRLYTTYDPAFPEDSVHYSGQQIYHSIWAPLEKYLHNVHTVYYAPAGILHTCAFDALPYHYDTLLMEKYDLVRLNSTKEILNKTKQGTMQHFLLAGGADYSVDDANNFWKALPGTEQEVVHIDHMLEANHKEVTLLTGNAFSENELTEKGMHNDVLHLATHGYFLSKNDSTYNGGSRFRKASNPLLRSGLILSGGNAGWSEDLDPSTDGIFTAYEISNLNLFGTKLVVLSACQTGLGDINASEGVYGLQRAFKMAGADALIISLWQVPDRYTTELMTLFYSALIETNNTEYALRKAQLAMAKKYPVFDWAAFVEVR